MYTVKRNKTILLSIFTKKRFLKCLGVLHQANKRLHSWNSNHTSIFSWFDIGFHQLGNVTWTRKTIMNLSKFVKFSSIYKKGKDFLYIVCDSLVKIEKINTCSHINTFKFFLAFLSNVLPMHKCTCNIWLLGTILGSCKNVINIHKKGLHSLWLSR